MERLFETADGSHSLLSGIYHVPYHSKYGAITETYHVFIDAALRFKAVVQQHIRILEIGFGTGLNAYATLLESEKRNLKIRYTAVEKFPLPTGIIQKLNYRSLLGMDHPSDYFQQMHELDWDVWHYMSSHFQIKKELRSFESLDYLDSFDIIYFDAFAPEAQPELWTKEMLTKMYHALKKEGILTTYCAKGIVKRNLKEIGFKLESLQGPPGKREMTRAVK